ncbi:MAG: hypothetical protein FGM41_02155 [Bacteroidetes bacterium]|nr:hypothetical protein [Bacteroidota bacterium]
MLYRFNLEHGFIPVSYESLLKDIFRRSNLKIKVEAIYQVNANIEERFLNLDAGQLTAQLVFADPKKLQQFLNNFQLLD